MPRKKTTTKKKKSTVNKAGNFANNIVGKFDNTVSKGQAQIGKVYEYTARFDTEWVTKILLVLIIGALFLGFMVLLKEIAILYNNKRKGNCGYRLGTHIFQQL